MVPLEGSVRTEISSGYAGYVLGLLFVVYVFNFIDRQILTILLAPITRDLGLSDTARGLRSFLVIGFIFSARQTLTTLLEPIKRELGVSDTAMGFLTGVAFAVFYTFA